MKQGLPVLPHEWDKFTRVIVFDGVCNFCNAFVNFVLDRDSHGLFKFGTLQSSGPRNPATLSTPNRRIRNLPFDRTGKTVYEIHRSPQDSSTLGNSLVPARGSHDYSSPDSRSILRLCCTPSISMDGKIRLLPSSHRGRSATLRLKVPTIPLHRHTRLVQRQPLLDRKNFFHMRLTVLS